MTTTHHSQVYGEALMLAIALDEWKNAGASSDLVVAKLLDLLAAIEEAPEDVK